METYKIVENANRKPDREKAGNSPSRLLKIRDASAFLALSERKFSDLVRDGRIPVVKIGRGCLRYDVSDLEEFIQKCKIGNTVDMNQQT